MNSKGIRKVAPLWPTFALAVVVAALPARALAISSVSAPTPPATASATYTYKTFLDPGRIGPGLTGNLNEDFGTLQLTFSPNKIIQGTYRPDYGNFMPVTGGITGAKTFWLSFGAGNVRFSGHFTHHGFVADSQGLSAGGRYWRLHGQFQHA